METTTSTPRLPKFFYNTYRQYKENESIIVHWVHKTASELRARARDVFSPPAKRGRAQGSKSRAKNARAQKGQPISDPSLASPKLSFRALLDLVEEIASSDVAIPTAYLAMLELSIKQRKKIAAFYSSNPEVSEDNRAHLHAIEVYSKALEVLKEAEKRRSDRDDELPSDIRGALTVQGEGDHFALSDAIQHLSLILQEDGFVTSPEVGSAENEWIRDNPMINSGKKQPKIQSFPLEEYGLIVDDELDSKTKETKRGRDDTLDRLHCFLFDVNNLRKYCNSVWREVTPAGNLSYMAASFVTNRAVQLVKALEYEMVSDMPSLKDIDHSYFLFYGAVFRDNLLKGQTQDSFDYLNDRTMFHTWHGLTQFAEVLSVNPFPVLRDGQFGYFDPSADRKKMSAQERLNEDRCIMLNHWPDLIIVNNKIKMDPFGSHGLVEAFKTFSGDQSRPVSWALLFACQMQADSVQSRRRYLTYDLCAMRNLGNEMDKEYGSFLNDGVLYDDNMEKDVKPFIKSSVVRVYNWLKEDFVTKIKLQNGWEKLSKQATQKDALWLQNSWLTANAISEATLEFYFLGVAVTGAGGFVQSAIQLWNMLRQTGYLPLPTSSEIVSEERITTKDNILLFDHLMDVFGDKVFSGPPPKSGFLKRWDLMMGVRAEEFSRGKRQYKQSVSRPRAHNEAGRGVLPTLSDLWNAHEANYIWKEKPLPQKRNSTDEFKHPLESTLELVNSELGLSSSSTTPPRGPLVNLNLFKIHRLCVRIFTELEPVLRPKIETILGAPLDHTQIQWPYLTGWIAKTEGLPANTVLLQMAAEVVQRVAGDKRLGFFLLRNEGDEGLILQ